MHKIVFQTTAEYEGALAHELPGGSDHGRTQEQRADAPKRGDRIPFGATIWVVDSVKEPDGDADFYTVVVVPTGGAAHPAEDQAR